MKQIIRNHTKLYANKLYNIEECGKFLETYNLLRLDHGEIENVKRQITGNEIESVILKLPTKTITRWLHW